MDNSFDDENIRPPDEIIRECLIEGIKSNDDKEIEEAIYMSLQEMNQQKINEIKYEEELINSYTNEVSIRKEIFKDFLFQMNKISKFDKEIREIYDIIDPIIESYCNQMIEICELDKITYDKIFNSLKDIRNNSSALEALGNIIIINNDI